jgi:fatty acid desaturase (delta-4 desaturase)
MIVQPGDIVGTMSRELFHSDAWMRILCHPVVFVGLACLYLISVVVGMTIMSSRKAVHPKAVIKVYNCVQIVVCLYMAWGILPSIWNPFGINSQFSAQTEWIVFVHYLSKYLDWFDTLFIILRKRRAQLSFLHVYHHMTISMVWGFLCFTGNGNGTSSYGAWVNSVTHVIMYSHYLWTSFGMQNPLKKMVTAWQITQFWSCLLHAAVVLCFESIYNRHVAWLQVGYQITMVYLFTFELHTVPNCVPDSLDEKKSPQPDQKWMIIRGQSYDISNFTHPGGFHMLALGVGRDATIMFESMHLRSELAEASLARLPKGPDPLQLAKANVPLDSVSEDMQTPEKSELYQVLRSRVRKEVMEPMGRCIGAKGSRGVPVSYFSPVLITWAVVATWFVLAPSAINAVLMGLSLIWIGLAVQHTANHGGLCVSGTWGYLLGLMNDIGPGGSSLCWRYHHQVSHHCYCNDVSMDQDVFSSFPFLRLDDSQKLQWFHRFQWIYANVLFCFLYFSLTLQDLQCVFGWHTFVVNFRGTGKHELLIMLLLKTVHVLWFFVLPAYLHGFFAMLLPWSLALGSGSFLLAASFIVSHNLDECKTMSTFKDHSKLDWASWQILTSSTWGGRYACFFMGGLNYQIEHHLFPSAPHNLYPAISEIVRDECTKRKLRYSYYPTLFANFASMIRFLRNMGRSKSE